MYASKRFSYSFPVYKARCQLAAIDYMKHSDHENITNKDGSIRLHRKFSKQTNHWTVCEEKEKKHYTYIPELMINIVNRYLTERIPLRHPVTVKEDDPKNISKTVAPVSPEPSHVLAAKKVSRFSKGT
ncbi:uncharacterized protein LOC121376952 [Gigantopelta aegis]|uniref:uncharacterized protein LOC121376952 n=1 Tax=Gigantopelta aegis TaxID=1735272 RepID=UPI001B88DB5C|nr:uncharacterized protein LOC121376952 [Gigantopelta aegis]